MIDFCNIKKNSPFEIFEEKYNLAMSKNQKNIEAVAISSFDKKKDEVDSRFVNLKFVNKNKLIFFTNYNSPKSHAFKSHDQISILIYWPVINTQIRMKAKIRKMSKDYNNNYFKNRAINKNALAISSFQSNKIPTYDDVIFKYKKALKTTNLKECPDYWGGFKSKPFEIEFWEGGENRLNKRNLYIKDSTSWNHFILEP